MLTVTHGDVLSMTADAIVLPIDGTFVPASEQYERLLGNVARQFLRAIPEADLLEQIEAQVDLPLALGKATAVELPDARFRFAVLVSTLHHLEVLDTRAKRALARDSFSAAIRCARQAGATRIATPILQGGWRLSPDTAFAAMLESSELAQDPTTCVEVAIPDAELAAQCAALARSMGYGAS